MYALILCCPSVFNYMKLRKLCFYHLLFSQGPALLEMIQIRSVVQVQSSCLISGTVFFLELSESTVCVCVLHDLILFILNSLS
jgi:hypothetical protein